MHLPTLEPLRACEARVWSFFRKYSEDMDRYLPYLNGTSEEPFPLYIKPNRKLTVQDMKDAMRDHFEGTPFDMSQDVGARPLQSARIGIAPCLLK